MHFITAQEVKNKLDTQNVTLIDIREPYEREICHIKNSIHAPMGDIENLKQSVNNSTCETVFICKSGKRAEATANLIEKELNINNIYILEGGIISWIETIDQTLEIY